MTECCRIRLIYQQPDVLPARQCVAHLKKNIAVERSNLGNQCVCSVDCLSDPADDQPPIDVESLPCLTFHARDGPQVVSSLAQSFGSQVRLSRVGKEQPVPHCVVGHKHHYVLPRPH